MKNYIQVDEWNIVEEGFVPELNRVSESIFSLGNGRMGQRANFEEKYSGDTLQGTYVAGVYYPDKTRVGWWKNGYPEYFAKVLNAPSWIGIQVSVDGEELDLATARVSAFRRVLHMKEGYLERSFDAELTSGKRLRVCARRFCSIVDDEAGAVCYAITALNFDGNVSITACIDGDVKNEDSNYDEHFWTAQGRTSSAEEAQLIMKTRKTDFVVCMGMRLQARIDDALVESQLNATESETCVGLSCVVPLLAGQQLVVHKLVSVLSSENHPVDQLLLHSSAVLERIARKGFDGMLREQSEAWARKWEKSDILIEGDVAAQQAIRFNIFQLNQTYTGEDDRLNIGPKGFTGEKYGGTTYWDTEAYCVPFYLATASPKVTRNLLIYRYKHLAKAIENARKLGFDGGAALYPMVTINGEECHNEWEITFEEIHRNGAIAHAIYNYIRYTGDHAYLAEFGLEVLVGIARFWKQRVNWSEARSKYVMLGVTGPNEYENNVNNNWYTSTIACWCLEYAMDALSHVKGTDAERYAQLLELLSFDEDKELTDWKHIIDNMYLPEDKELGVFLQQDGFMDKEQILVKDLAPQDRPLNQRWSWDRILRSVFIKQADVLQGLYFFEDRYDMDTLRRNFDFYEARTVHESSLSPCVHAILAARLGDEQRAYDFYLRTARLDLDDYNNDTEDGLHITSMAGTWMSVVEGFAGMRVRNSELVFRPFIPTKWESFSFNITFRGAALNVKVRPEEIVITNNSEIPVTIRVFEESRELRAGACTFVLRERAV